jgi:hypothetical protein
VASSANAECAPPRTGWRGGPRRRDWAGRSPTKPTTITPYWRCATGGCSRHGRGGPCHGSPRPWATSVSPCVAFSCAPSGSTLRGHNAWYLSSRPQFAATAAAIIGLDLITGLRVVVAGRREVGDAGLERAHGYLKLPNDRALTRCTPSMAAANEGTQRPSHKSGLQGHTSTTIERLSSSLDEVLLLTGAVIRVK